MQIDTGGSMKIKYLKGLAVLALMAFGISSAQAANHPDDDWQSERLVGSWMFQISLQDCTSHAAIGAPFFSLLTFNRGGTVTETTANPAFVPPTVRGPGHGIWRHDGRRGYGYEAVTTAFITVNGVLSRTQTITQTIELEGPDKLKTTSASVKFFSPTGSLLMTGCAEASGKRTEF
jgi:hypothetical protein